jgi:hypothetical protein
MINEKENTKEVLSPYNDVELGERDIKVNYYFVINYRIYVHPGKQKQIYYVYYFIVKNEITEYIRIIRKDTAIVMLSRMNNIYEDKIRLFIPNFEQEREKVQLHDRIYDYDQILTDKEIEKQLNKVQYFDYFGQQGYCGKAYPHLPHIIDYYNTVRYGKLPVYCLGKQGFLRMRNGKKVYIMITKSCSEGCTGQYVVFELLEE